jgi:hypothetical protein
MFEGARSEIERTRETLDALRFACDQREFLTRFNDVVGSAQLVLIAMLREGRGERLPGFAQWYEVKREALDNDELMSVVREARDYDFSDGPHRLRFISGPTNLRVDDQGRPVKEGAWWSLPAAPTTHVALDSAPSTHDGQPLQRTDPLAFCTDAIAYLEGLLAEAEAVIG